MNDQLANQLRTILKDESVNARVQTYRNHEDISIYPSSEAGWNDEQFMVVLKMIEGANLSTLSERVTGRKTIASNQVKGFRYLRLKEV